MKKMPIEDVLVEVRQQLSIHRNSVLVAPPGAGQRGCYRLIWEIHILK